MFLTPEGLRQHKVLHVERDFEEKYPHECDTCEKRFRKKYELEVHVRTHTGERPFQCEHCEQSFRALQTLKVHRQIHAPDRPDPVYKVRCFHFIIHFYYPI